MGILLWLVITAGISVWNAYAVGRLWPEVKQMDFLTRATVVSGMVMSAIGFIWLFMIAEATILHAISPIYGTNEETGLREVIFDFNEKWMKLTFQLGYVATALPLLGSGLCIWAHSLVVAWRERTLVSGGIAAYNTWAQIHNTISVATHMPGFIGKIGEAIFKDLNKDKLMLIVVLLLTLTSIIGGTAVMWWIVASVAKKRETEMREEALAYAHTHEEKHN